MRLSGPVTATIRDRKDREERVFVIEVDGVEEEIRVRVRGSSRSQRDVCAFPPLRLHFGDAGGVFTDQHKLKLVTHCRNNDAGDANAMEEYLAYRILSLLTPDAFRVRPLRITYNDTDNKLSRGARHRYGFLLESTGELGTRRGGKFIDIPHISIAQLDPAHSALVYVFQYLIGNTDWSLVAADGEDYCCHNGRPLQVGDVIRYVPYDFDLAGLVNAPYATTDPRLHLRSVRVRRYRGFCTDRDLLRSTVRTIAQRKQEIHQLVRTTPGLGDRHKKFASAYLDQFFNAAQEEDALLDRFESRCLGRTG